VISDGNSMDFDIKPFWSNTTSKTAKTMANTTTATTTVHSIAIGGLIQMNLLRKIRTKGGTYLEFRNEDRDIPRLSLLIGYLATNIHPQSIETVRCRFTYPGDKISHLELLNQPTYSPESNSLTLSPPPPQPLPYNPRILIRDSLSPPPRYSHNIHPLTSPSYPASNLR
jgi:hypothetical protein